MKSVALREKSSQGQASLHGHAGRLNTSQVGSFCDPEEQMQGTLQKERSGYRWMRIGFASDRFSILVKLGSTFTLIILAIWAYLEIPATEWRWAIFLVIYLVSAILYLNFGVWLHEQLHCLGFSGSIHAKKAHITYERKHLLVLSGHYRVEGGISYQIASRALLGPLLLSIGLLVVGCLGSLVLPGWWMPLMLSMVIASLMDMIHDFYMYSQIRLIGDKGKYWDRGKVLEVVWRG
jgi:hypothetical protein